MNEERNKEWRNEERNKEGNHFISKLNKDFERKMSKTKGIVLVTFKKRATNERRKTKYHWIKKERKDYIFQLNKLSKERKSKAKGIVLIAFKKRKQKVV